MDKVIIKVDRIKAIKQNFYVLLFYMVFFVFALSVNLIENARCNNLFGINAAYLSGILFTLVVPIFFSFASISIAKQGYAEIKCGYSPAIGTYNFIKEQEAKSGVWVKVRGYFSLIGVPIISIILLSAGVYSYNELYGGLGYSELVTEIEVACNKNA